MHLLLRERLTAAHLVVVVLLLLLPLLVLLSMLNWLPSSMLGTLQHLCC